jgi:serine/threonine-protein kinase
MAASLELDAGAWAALRRLLDDALELPRAERAAWLAALRPEHAALRPHLERLLAHADDDTGLARFDALPRLAPASPHEEGAGAPVPPPDTGPYRCIRLVAEGGMSSVWLAERTDVLLNRPVALKRPRAAWRSDGLAQRMAQEREILGLLDHPNIARIYDAGVGADGQPWLALEYVDGQPIDAYCRAHGLGPREIVKLVLQVADAVAHAHARLVVHRDLKPSNILVTPEGTARLLDFGIAKLVGEARGTQADLTMDAPQPRTPWYAAPEQLLGQPVSVATDIYALGAVLYELLAGVRPYRPARDTAAALEEAILRAEPARPSAVVADRARARLLRDDLDTIVLKAMKKPPGERYRSVTEFADDLEHWLHDRPIRARPDSARYRAAKFVVRNRGALAVAGALALSLCVGLAAALWQAGRAGREAAKALAIKDYLVGLFEANDIDQRDALRRREQSVQQLLETSAATLASSLAGQPEVRDELEQVVGRLLGDLELTDAAIRLRRERVAQLEALGAPLGVRVDALRELATSQRLHSDLASARASLERADALCAGAGRDHAIACSVARMELGRVDFAERHLDAALARVEPAAQALRREAPGRIELADALDLLGMLRAKANRGDDAVALYQESIAIRRAVWGPDSVRYAIARFRLGRDLWALRHLERAEGELREAWRIVAAALGPAHIGTARIEMNLGRLTYYVGLRDDGLAHLQKASRSIVDQAAHVDPLDVLDARVALGNALLLDGQLAAAGAELERALVLRGGLGESALADPTLDQSYARYLLDLGRHAEARAWLEDFRARAVRTYGEGHPEVAERGLRLALAWLAEGRLDEAQREIDRVLDSRDANEALFGSVKHKAQLARVALLLEQGRGAEARPVVEAQLAAVARVPREDQFRDVLYQLHDLAARTAAQVGDTAHARDEFERAIALLQVADARHPYLAATRSRYASLLARAGDAAGARRQLDLARPAYEAQPPPGEQFQRPWREALADVRSPAAGSVPPVAGLRP